MLKCRYCGKPVHAWQKREVRAWGNVRTFYHKACLIRFEKQIQPLMDRLAKED